MPLLSAAGPYSAGLNDPDNPYDAPVPGFVGPQGVGTAAPVGEDGFQTGTTSNFVNPIFFGWANGYLNYVFNEISVDPGFDLPEFALGPVTGDMMDVVSLGDLNAAEIAQGMEPGTITLTFPAPIRNFTGADFVVFENSLGSRNSVFAELAYVEVSSDGVNFARFPSVSLNPEPSNPLAWQYAWLDPRKIFNLAGKHINSNGQSWGTPFFLEDLADDPMVTGGLLDLNAITHVRIVDIPGSVDFTDSEGNPIYDAWPTWGSGGFDLEAVGVIGRAMTYGEWIYQSGLVGQDADPLADPSGNGVVNLLEYATGGAALKTGFKPGEYRGTLTDGSDENFLSLRFVRDERLTDLRYLVQVSDDLKQWVTIAQSTGGAPLSPQQDFTPVIHEVSASLVASVGVLRQVEVRDVVPVNQDNPKRFMRLQVEIIDE